MNGVVGCWNCILAFWISPLVFWMAHEINEKGILFVGICMFYWCKSKYCSCAIRFVWAYCGVFLCFLVFICGYMPKKYGYQYVVFYLIFLDNIKLTIAKKWCIISVCPYFLSNIGLRESHQSITGHKVWKSSHYYWLGLYSTGQSNTKKVVLAQVVLKSTPSTEDMSRVLEKNGLMHVH